MKRYILSILLLSGLTVAISGCDKFLDVRPKGTLTNDEMFSDIQGYRDAMYGVYASMADGTLYGENLSYGFVDKIGQMLVNPNPTLNDVKVSDYRYLDQTVRPTIDQIWESEYAVISYVNNILTKAEETNITHEDLKLIQGEAYGVRAFLHFDLLRLFASDYIQKTSETGIPYAYSYDLKNKTLFSLKDSYANVLKDLDYAEKLLESDPMDMTDIARATGPAAYRMSRYVNFNKFAVDALRARVYRAMGDYERASKYSAKVIEEGKACFSLVKPGDFGTVRRFPANGELIFGLFTRRLNENVSSLFIGKDGKSASVGSGNIAEGRRDLENLYETVSFSASNTDERYNTFYKHETSGDLFTRLLASSTEKVNAPLSGITLIRLPEMYLILAESQFGTDPSKAIETLNTLRASRGLEPRLVSSYATQGDFNAELLREYMREFPGEGQVFFAFKHFNIPLKAFNGVNDIEPSDSKFVLPWPELEKQFGSVGKN